MENYQPYGDFEDVYFAQRLRAIKNERKEIRRLGMFAGGAILLYILIQNVLALLMQVAGIYTLYQSDPMLQAGIDILIVLASMLPPFLLLSKPMQAISGVSEVLPLHRPVHTGQFVLAIPAGLGFCILANQVTGVLMQLLSAFLSRFQLEAVSAELPMPDGALGMAVSFFRIVVVAAICEELCFRGVVMQHLRRYGDWFAIFMAALVFGLMHCNLIQAPFALIVGVALGYLTIKTGTIWTALVIHAMNNALSLAVSYLLDIVPEETLNVLYLAVTSALMVVGLFCFLLFVLRQRRWDGGAQPVRTLNGGGAKTAAFLSSPTMLFAIGLMLYFTTRFIKRTGAG